MKSETLRSYHHGDLRRALVEAGAQLAAEGGVGAVKTSTLAKQLGVSSGAPFRHFPTREALLVTIAEEGARQQLSAMHEAAEGLDHPGEAQQAMGIAYVRWAVERPGYFRVLSRAESIAGSDLLRAQSQLHLDRMDADFASKQADPNVRLLTGHSAAVLAARAMVFGLARMCVDGLLGDVDADTAARLAQEITDVLGHGLATLDGDPP
ncbi:MAG: TetR/AcrR family transcriptional regulator [Myxococcota bacterium]